ncbi:MAG: glycosyltransferase [Actinomycetota bacterium]
MRILVVTNMYPPHHFGGYELSCRDVVERWRAQGHKVGVLTTSMRVPDVADPAGEREAGVWRDLRSYWEDHRIVSPPLWRRVAIERSNQRALISALEEARPDVVSVWHMGAMSFGLLATLVERGLPIVYVVCDEWMIYGPKADAWSRLFLGRPRLAGAVRALTGLPTRLPDLGQSGAFCFASEAMRRSSERRSIWKPATSSVVYLGVDRHDFPPEAKPRQRPWRWRLLCVGRLDERKGVHVAVEALARLPEEASLEVLGRGDDRYRRRLRKLVARHALAARVHFGEVAREALREHYAEADVFVFPVIWQEPFGLVPLEAMACGTPVVATGTGGSAEFLRDGFNCLVVPPGDPGALAAAVRRLADDPGLRARLIEAGLRTVEGFDVERLAERLEAWHIAAAEGFARGYPPDTPSPLAGLAGPG